MEQRVEWKALERYKDWQKHGFMGFIFCYEKRPDYKYIPEMNILVAPESEARGGKKTLFDRAAVDSVCRPCAVVRCFS